MIEPVILAAIHARLDRALALPAVRYRPFVVGGHPLGRVDDTRAARLARFGPRLFRVDDHRVALADELADCASRSAALTEVSLALRAEGALPAWRDELYSIAAEFGAPPEFRLERGAARYFGVRTFAAHVNGVVSSGSTTRMWLARRSMSKAMDPGLLDNLVAGGIAAGLTIEETVVKEAWEEAGIHRHLASTARPAGSVDVRRQLADGLQRETVFVHDLALAEDFVPVNQDGEAVEHRRVTLSEAARAIAVDAGPDEVTVDASLVVLDYLLRHRAVAPTAPGFAGLESLLRRGA